MQTSAGNTKHEYLTPSVVSNQKVLCFQVSLPISIHHMTIFYWFSLDYFEDCRKEVIEMEHFEPEIAEIVTKYLHNGRINLCADTVMDIFQMAIFLQLDELSRICAGFMQDSVNLTNCIAFWKFAGN